MVWLSVEVIVIVWDTLRTGVIMLIAKTPKLMAEILAENMPLERLKAIVEKREKVLREKEERSNGEER